MEPNFSEENYEKARAHYRESSIKHTRAKRLLDLKDYSGSVEASQHTVEFCIKTFFVLAGLPIPKTHDPGSKLDIIFNEIKKIDPNSLKDLKIDPFSRIKYLSNVMSRLHMDAMYGTSDGLASSIFTKEDAEYYYQIAFEIWFLSLLISFIFNVYHENIPEEGMQYLSKIAPEFFKRKK